MREPGRLRFFWTLMFSCGGLKPRRTFVTAADLIRNPENMAQAEPRGNTIAGRVRTAVAAEPFDNLPLSIPQTRQVALLPCCTAIFDRIGRGTGAKREAHPADSRRCRVRLWRLCPARPVSGRIVTIFFPDVLAIGVV